MFKRGKSSNKIPLGEAIRLGMRGYFLWWKKYPMMLISSVLCSVVGALTPYVEIYLTAKIINEIAGNRDANTLLQLVLITLFSTIALALINSGLSRWEKYEYAGQWHKRNKLYTDKLLSMDFCDVDDPHIHNLLVQIKQNEDWFGWGLGMLLQSFKSLIQSLITIVGAIALSISLFTFSVPDSAGKLVILNNPLFIILIIAVMLNVTLLVPFLTNKANSYWANFADDVKMCTQFESYFKNLPQNLSLALDIRTYRQDILSEKYFEDSVSLADRSKKTLASMRLFHSASTAVSYVFTAIVYLFVCLKAWGGAYSVGSVTQYIAAITAMSNGTAGLFKFFGDMQNNAPFIKKVFEFFDAPNSMCKGNIPVDPCPENKYEIEFRNVSFKYPAADNYALKNISLKFNAKQRLAVVGQNGSGKSTFIKLLCRLYDPTEGEIYLNGIDIREYNYQQYIDIFSVVFQDFKLLSYGLGQNVSASIEYDEDKVNECLDKAGFGERIKTLPKGLDTYLYKDFADDGVEISGGEAQKIALARALYKNAHFLILDEPTAALDPVSEFEIYNRMNGIAGDKTVIFISHRLSSCRFCNDIVVFHEGKLIQRGSHNELVSDESGKYYELWNAQAQYYNN